MKKSSKKTVKKSVKTVSKSKKTSSKASKKDDASGKVVYIESKKPQFKIVPDEPEIEEETFVKTEDITKLLASRMNDIMSTSPVKMAENMIREYNDIMKELCDKHCEFTILSNKKVKRVFIKARKYNSVGDSPTLVKSHFEMKFPVIFDSKYDEDKVSLSVVKDKEGIKNGKGKFIEVDEAYLENLDEKFMEEHPDHFEALNKRSKAVSKTDKKKTSTKKATTKKVATGKKKVVKKK